MILISPQYKNSLMTVYQNINLKKYNTFKIDANCTKLIILSNKLELLDLYSGSYGNIFKEKHLILGSGSNILLTGDFDGVIIKLDFKNIDIQKLDTSNEYLLTAEAGNLWHNFVQFTVQNGFSGLESLALIPGTVGAAPIQNIGAYGYEQADFLYSVEVFNKRNGKFEVINKEDCGFSYRDSIFKKLSNFDAQHSYIICSVTYKLTKATPPILKYKDLLDHFAHTKLDITSMNVFNAVCAIRNSKLPDFSIEANAGSFFKNPIISKEASDNVMAIDPKNKAYPYGENGLYKVSAARLIEFCGFKGFRQNEAGVSSKHSLVLVNYGNAKGEEINNLSNIITKKVYETFGIMLEKEVNII